MTVLLSVLGFVLVMGLLVFIHEWGHFQTARLFNIKVKIFSIGFGKSIWSTRVGETEYRLSMIPLGGYVKFLDEREGKVDEDERHRAFNTQSVYKRFAVVVAGPIINLVFAWVVFSVMNMVGIPGLKPVFEGVESNSPMARTGLVENRQAWVIREINNMPVESWKQVHHIVLAALVNSEKQLKIRLQSFNEDVSQSELVSVSIQGIHVDDVKDNWISLIGFVPKRPDLPVVLDQVLVESPANLGGFVQGDHLLSFNQTRLMSWSQFVNLVRKHPDQVVSVEFKRNGAVHHQQLVLGRNEMGGGYFGASVQVQEDLMMPYQVSVKYGLLDAMSAGLEHVNRLIQMSLVMVKKMLWGEASIENLSGPVTIADFSGQAIQSGWVSFLSLLGLLSLSLGIINLLPIPLLDGGHLFFYVVEMIKGSPVSPMVESFAQQVGLMIILSLTFLALFNDIVRITNG